MVCMFTISHVVQSSDVEVPLYSVTFFGRTQDKHQMLGIGRMDDTNVGLGVHNAVRRQWNILESRRRLRPVTQG